MPKLFIYPKKGEGFEYDLDKEKLSIGRSADNEIMLPDPFSSGHHAVIYLSEGRFILRDSGSKNGTFLNGKKLAGEAVLKKGDEILIGSTRLIFDRALSHAPVEVSEMPSPARSINTIIHLNDILKKTDIETTMQNLATPADFLRIRSDVKSMAVLNEVSQALILHQPLGELLNRVMDLISEYLPIDRGVLMLREGNPPQMIPKVTRINNRNLARQKIVVSQSIINLVLDNHSSVLTTDAQKDKRFSDKESVILSNIHSAMCVPLWNNREIIGVLYADRIMLLDQFSEEDLRLLTLLANLAAVKYEQALAVERAIEMEKFQKELALASQIQKDFQPKENPVCENFDIAGTNIPCLHIGGDYYDFIRIDPCRMAILVADVSGKGISAALLMASLRAALHAEINPQINLVEMIAKLNDFVHRSSAANRFITFFFSDLNLRTGELRYINAGHNPPLHIAKDGKVTRLESGGFCLGMFPDVSYEEKKIHLSPGEIVVLFTDGITETLDPQKQEFGEENLAAVLQKNSKQSAAEIVEQVLDELRHFCGGAAPLDDMTLVVIKRTA